MRWAAYILAVSVFAMGCDGDSRGRRVRGTGAPSGTTAPSTTASAAMAPKPGDLEVLDPRAVAGAKLLLDKADRQSDARVRLRMSAGILEELEERRLPPRAVAALAAASERKVVPEHRAKVVWEAISRTPRLLSAFNETCRPGPLFDGGRVTVLLFGRTKDPRERAATLFAHCRWAEGGLVSLDTMTLDYDLVMLAHVLKAHLESRGGLAPVEERAIRLMARGAVPPKPPLSGDDLPTLERPDRLAPQRERVLQQRVAAGHALLEAGNMRRFFEEIVHPSEVAGVRLDEAVRVFTKKGKNKELRADFAAAKGRPARDDDEGEASVLLPWRPDTDARERLRFQLHEGVWRLRL